MLLNSDLSAQKPDLSISWKKIAAVPSSDSNGSPGYAGAINGVHNNVFIVAGGSNFPNGKPWEGGKKFYSDKIFVLEKKDNDFIWNKRVNTVLPEPIAYCGSTSTPSGIVYVGGENEKGNSNKCYLLKWNGEKNRVDITSLPDLPLALTNIAVTNIGNVIYAVGGDEATHSSNEFCSLDLNNGTTAWKILPHLPLALANATAIAQNGKSEKEIFVIGGRSKTSTGNSDLHNTTFAFDPRKQQWKKCADISDGKNISNLSAAAGIAFDKNYILMIGGDNGIVFHKIEAYISQIAKAGTKEEKEKLTNEKNALSIHHKGFYKGLLLYDTKRNKWTKIGDYPFPAQVTTTAVMWGNEIVISTGEIKPGIRTPDVVVGDDVRHKEK